MISTYDQINTSSNWLLLSTYADLIVGKEHGQLEDDQWFLLREIEREIKLRMNEGIEHRSEVI